MNGKKHSGAKCNRDEVINTLIEACDARRPIVPLLGAGISVESGYPASRAIVRYLAKVKYYLDNQLYSAEHEEPLGTDTSPGARKRLRDQWLSRFGWPDPYQLNEDLWSSGRGRRPRNPLDLESKINQVYLEEWQQESSDLMDKLKNVSSVPQPNWRPFLRSVTGGRADHVDSLFQMFNRGRVPGNSHRFLAFLARLLNWKLILTTNFDDLIEKALRSQGLEPTVFDVWRQAELPNKLLVEGGLSVVKLHGSAYGLRAGESLDDPLTVDEKTKLVAYMPKNTLLLVLGNGGSDRRIMDLVEAVLEQDKIDSPRVVWMHFEDEPPISVRELVQFDGDEGQNGSPSAEQNENRRNGSPSAEQNENRRNGSPSAEQNENRPNLYAARTLSAGAFLVGLYSRLAHVHPASTNQYSAHLQRPLGVKTEDLFDGQEHAPANGVPGISVHIFAGIERGKSEADISYHPVDATSIAMSEFLAEKASSHLPIWIDAGMFQSVEEVISDIMRQCRVHDSALPRVVLPARETGDGEDDAKRGRSVGRDAELARMVRRVQATLRRGSYIVAIDEIRSFGRSPTTHHGLQRDGAEDIKPKVSRFYCFLERLVKDSENCGESLICLAINDIAVRSEIDDQEEESNGAFEEIESELKDLRFNLTEKGDYGHRVEVHECVGCRHQTMDDQIDQFKKPIKGLTSENLENLKALVVFFRRPRSLVALQKLFRKYCRPGSIEKDKAGSYEQIDEWLKQLQKNQILAPLEGELYWIGTHLRDKVHSQFSEGVTPAKIKKATNSQAVALPEVRKMAADLVRLIVIHKGISRYYYTDLFHPSKDISAYYEYLYHRITSLRYAARLAALLIARGRHALPPGSAPGPDMTDPDDVTEYMDALPPGSAPGPDMTDLDDVTEYMEALRRAAEPAQTVLEKQLNDIRAFARTLDRDRDAILSLSSSNTLLHWFKWIVDKDLKQFKVGHYMDDPQTLKLDDPQTLKQIEDIENEALKLGRTLRNLYAKVLREKSDYDECIRERIKEIHELLDPLIKNKEELTQLKERTLKGVNAVSAGDADYSFLKEAVKSHEQWIRSLLESGPDRDLFGSDSDPRYSVLLAWLEISDCLRFLGELDTVLVIIESLEGFTHWDPSTSPQGSGDHQSAQSRRTGCDEQEENLNYLKLRLWYGRAHRNLARTRAKCNGNEDLRDSLLDKAKTEIGKGLNVVREMKLAPDKYFIYRSLLYSLRGKVLAKQNRTLEAYREFHRAANGLDGRTGEGRYALAIRSLSMAEALTEHCGKPIEKHPVPSGNQPSSQSDSEVPEQKRRQKADHDLDRARRSLQDAEALLASGRRDIEAWRSLHVLGARVHLEGIKLVLSEISEIEQSNPRPDDSPEARREQLGSVILDEIPRGLCAIRDARDNLLDRPGRHNREDPRMEELRELYKEYRGAWAEHKRRQRGVTDRCEDLFWKQWASLARLAGVSCFLGNLASIREWFDTAMMETAGPESRIARTTTTGRISSAAGAQPTEQNLREVAASSIEPDNAP